MSAFLKTARGEHAFLLESVVGGDKWGRYSFLGSEPAAIFTSRGTTVLAVRAGQARRADFHGERSAGGAPRASGGVPRGAGRGSAALLRRRRRLRRVRRRSLLRALAGDVARSTLGLPELYFIVPASLLVFDTVAQSIKVVVNVDLRDPATDPQTAYEAAAARIDELVTRLAAPLTLPEPLPATDEGLPVTANMTAPGVRRDRRARQGVHPRG